MFNVKKASWNKNTKEAFISMKLFRKTLSMHNNLHKSPSYLMKYAFLKKNNTEVFLFAQFLRLRSKFHSDWPQRAEIFLSHMKLKIAQYSLLCYPS